MTDKLREYASTQVNVPELWPAIKAWIESHIAPEQLDPEHGIETDSHVTVLYGLISENLAPIRVIAEKFGKPITLAIDELAYFENEDHDVLYAAISSRDLHKLRKLLSALPNANEHKTYIPHLTIAYLRKGEGARYSGQKPFKAVFTKMGFYFSKKDSSKEFIPTTAKRSFLLGEVPKRLPLSDSVDNSSKKEYN